MKTARVAAKIERMPHCRVLLLAQVDWKGLLTMLSSRPLSRRVCSGVRPPPRYGERKRQALASSCTSRSISHTSRSTNSCNMHRTSKNGRQDSQPDYIRTAHGSRKHHSGIGSHFSSPNGYGILDHTVYLLTGLVYVPLRVVKNGIGCDVMLTRPGEEVSDAAFAAIWLPPAVTWINWKISSDRLLHFV